jgi:hypothetical protein
MITSRNNIIIKPVKGTGALAALLGCGVDTQGFAVRLPTETRIFLYFKVSRQAMAPVE